MAIFAALLPAGHADAATARRATAVVADVSPGVNPYHEAFRRPGWTTPPSVHIPGFPKNAVRLDLTFGTDWARSRAADAATWKRYRPRTLYWVAGTNLLLYTELSPGWPPDGRSPEQDHGTASAGAVGESCRECYVLVVQDYLLAGAAVRRIAKEMRWVDVVVSTNMQGDPHNPAIADATRDLDKSGRHFVAASGNTPVTSVTPVPFPYYDLPPWVVVVGGSHEKCRAAEATSGKPADFTGDYSQVLPSAASVRSTTISHGTSFAAPKVAGAFGMALVALRHSLGSARAPGYLWTGARRQPDGVLADGRLTHTELYTALAAVARYFRMDEYTSATTCYVPVPVSPTPWVELGWGHAGRREGLLAGQAIVASQRLPTKPPAAVAYLAAWHEARAAAFSR